MVKREAGSREGATNHEPMKTEYAGRKIVAEVVRVEPYGVYLAWDGEEVIVLVPDVSDERILCLAEEYRPGQRVSVRILEYVESRKMFKGTIKDV